MRPDVRRHVDIGHQDKTFSQVSRIDANGILHVTAKDKATNKEQSIRIEASTGLTDAEIKRMRDEAAANAEEDRKAKEMVDKLNAADSLIFQTEKQMKEYQKIQDELQPRPPENGPQEMGRERPGGRGGMGGGRGGGGWGGMGGGMPPGM